MVKGEFGVGGAIPGVLFNVLFQVFVSLGANGVIKVGDFELQVLMGVEIRNAQTRIGAGGGGGWWFG